ncbi:UMTA methyltransferase family protein [Rutstroemia sp. NJR-2017a BBW]|nr:UMTA methyltransferase family protein [Rutstroemia sp. NJR-2017a BBW]
MDHSHIAACRLNLQHYLWKDALKFNIHPSIKISNESTIADVATGTAAWLLDVADLPSDLVGKYDYVHVRLLVHLLTMNEFASSLMRIGKVDAAHTFYRLIEDGYKESTAGAALCIPRIVCVGQKPS